MYETENTVLVYGYASMDTTAAVKALNAGKSIRRKKNS